MGRGIADITGEPADCELLGYGKSWQRSRGLHTRLRSRAFAFDSDGTRLLLIVNDLPLVFSSLHRAVLAELDYPEANVLITATHTHCGPGGYAHHLLYNLSNGFHPQTFQAIVDGMLEAAERAEADLAEATVSLAHGELHDASVNRSKVAFDRNPADDRAFFPPGGIDPQTSDLRIERGGRVDGVLNFFATHGTSMTNRNRLISSDNKGYAALHWERHVEAVDYAEPSFVSAFAQTNAGDMSPNLNRRAGSGPTEDEFANTRIIGTRQYDAAAKLLSEPGVPAVPVAGPLDARLTYVDLSACDVAPEFTSDGRMHRTSGPFAGAAALAGTDEGKGFAGFRQERNPVVDALSERVFYRSAALRDSQAPKGLAAPGALLNRVRPFIATRYPMQLLRLGPLYLIGIPGEVTVVAGLRLRRVVAGRVGADVRDVLVVGYSNGYFHYVTTPEEYDAQRYEGGSTMFGRWQLPALQQTVAGLATALHDGVPVDRGEPEPDLSAKQRPARRKPPADDPQAGRVLSGPRAEYVPGQQVRVTFAGAYPNNDLHRGGTYLDVQRLVGDVWT
ncbi:MAG: neutral/alkaline non-lysosomal ceramidase N-terminal domain-containing protein, partial [Thermocrispum sp.]